MSPFQMLLKRFGFLECALDGFVVYCLAFVSRSSGMDSAMGDAVGEESSQSHLTVMHLHAREGRGEECARCILFGDGGVGLQCRSAHWQGPGRARRLSPLAFGLRAAC